MKQFLSRYKSDFLFYACVNASLLINFLYLYSQLDYPMTFSINSLGPFIYTLINCVIISLPYFAQRKKFHIFFIYLIIVDLLFIANLVYFRNYGNVIPLFSYAEINNLNGLENSIIASMKIADIIPILATIACYVAYLTYFKKQIVGIQSIKHRLIITASIIAFSIGIAFMGITYSKLKGISPAQKFCSVRTKQPYFVSYYGIIPLLSFQAYSHFKTDSSPLSEAEKLRIENFISKNTSTTNIVNDTVAPKNLIVIVVESLSSWVTKMDSGKATPFLNKLANSPDVIYIPHVLPQVKHARSADAQLMINTGLLPPIENAITNIYSGNQYPSLADALRKKADYYSLTAIGNEAIYWNQKTMNQAYHFDELLSIETFKKDEIIGMGLSDESIFRQVAEHLATKSSKPFYAQIITLSSHDGIDFASKQSDVNFPANFPEEDKNFVKGLQYTDKAIEGFFNELKNKCLYNNSVIAIMADHDGLTANRIRPYAPELLDSLENGETTFIPLYIVNAPANFKTKKRMMQEVDIFSTLLDIMNVENYFWRGIGQSIFSENIGQTGVDKEFNIIGTQTEDNMQQISLQMEAWKVSDLIIRKDYFRTQLDN